MLYFHLILAAFLLDPSLLPADEAPLPEKALCVVCALKDGESEFEKVEAHSDHKGKAYYFCSTDCQEEFDADFAAWLSGGALGVDACSTAARACKLPRT